MPVHQSLLDKLVRLADADAASSNQSPLSDADLAAQLSIPTRTPKPDRVTYTTCAGTWGTAAAALFRARMRGAVAAGQLPGAAADVVQFGALADYIDTLLSGPGIDPTNPEVPTQSAAFVASGLATQDQVDGVFNLIVYPAGGAVQAGDVTASRARVARADAAEALRARVINVAAGWVNDVLNVAEADADATLPTYADFKASLLAE